MQAQAGEMTGLEGRHRLARPSPERGEPVDRRDARLVQAVLQDGLGVRAEDQGQLEPGQMGLYRRGHVPVTEQAAHRASPLSQTASRGRLREYRPQRSGCPRAVIRAPA